VFRFHQPQIKQLTWLPFKGCRVVPFKGWDVKDAAWILFQCLGCSERPDGRCQIVMPRAGICIVFFVIKGLTFALFQTLFSFEECDAVNLTAGQRKVFFIVPAESTEEIQLTVFRVIVLDNVRAPVRNNKNDQGGRDLRAPHLG
jgi:hypothetical protein